MPNYPYRAGSGNGGNKRLVEAARRGALQWDWSPEYLWWCSVSFRDVTGAGSTQSAAITIPAAGFVSGRLTATFTGYGLGSPVNVVADAAVADVNTDLATTLAAAIVTAAGGSLAGVVDASAETSNVVDTDFVVGIPAGAVTVAYAPAQVIDTTFGGTDLVDGAYTFTFTGGGLGAPVPVTTTRGGAVLTVADLAVQAEADIEALVGSTLAGVVVSADDDAVDTNTIQMEPGIAAVVVALTVPPFPQAWDSQFGGTETDGNYDHIFSHASLPSDVTVRTTRVGAVPATNAALAVQAETDIEGDPQLATLIASADDDAVDTNEIRTYAGISGLTVTAAAPAPGTLVPTDVTDGPTLTQADATPAGPTITVSHASVIDLNVLGAGNRGAFQPHAWRLEVAVEVVDSFGAGTTVTVGHAADAYGGSSVPDALLGSTPRSTASGNRRWLGLPADAEYADRYEPGLIPTATIALGAAPALTGGSLIVQITWAAHPSRTASAA